MWHLVQALEIQAIKSSVKKQLRMTQKDFFRSTSNTDEPDNCRTISISNSDEPGNYSTMSTAQLQRTCLIEQIKAAIAQRKAAEAQERATLKYLQDSQKEKDYINLTPM